ncbi:MAG: CDP-diacylglycerol--glycerol-3-phosphate 3-phosphatidyltransferase [Ignavibacteria bacterium GWA2_35_9]|nr:MAG: CDP-diacylglycerol--glycerol-3-phosphate 3-phosphatidyltransferase [Ignavibacteria bacterium GWA2_35_9]OGU48086.1 MAG: CDP-diacylglycerol--glycerol-3-phosphate 3-phosphatidyltransferase [Ignavibacteria bacterium GWB2_36_8]OGU48522.1 MAG: CDP-diacylglycerol--glycerol-3-phosphate 3-phosphatidyltransferase [Ignavibacteria bacterium GWC2_36_12]OGU98637.1 MAG: CDP-diacylglycerol--glycerol-3-phosphate 3-phosphatidyltransferase [Ignavibacteria bacterium RIFOXYA2_FULL_37_17]OGV05150.1 MAG: CDP-
MVLPNQLTILRIILTPFFLFFFLFPDPLYKQISLGIFIVAALTDWYDGWLARKFNYITTWGKFWDPLADKILTSSAFLGFAILGVLEFWMVMIILIRDFIVTGLRAYADYKNFSFPTSYYAKWKTFIQMTFLYYLLAVYVCSHTVQLYTGNEKLFALLMNDYLIYFTMLFITIITFHSGADYLYKNRLLIAKLIRNKD